ncbi:MAG: S8 family serine peptidase, partial [Chitinophagales bacterium]|nr:S8 family serine peptidase [Hyphomicrobiales bacterium]
SDPLLKRLFQSATGKGLILVAAVGNAGPQSPPLYPAAYEGVIAVTATGPSNALFEKANCGDYIGIAAPGVDIFTPTPEGVYDISSGTSIAAAHVSGILALMLEKRPDASAGGLRSMLFRTAMDLGVSGPDTEFGVGLVDAEKAVTGLLPVSETATATGGN